MKISLYLGILWNLLTLILCSLESRIGSDWFRQLEKADEMTRWYEFDFMASIIFLKKQVGTSVFSPLCADVNILAQIIEGEFEHFSRSKAKDDLKFIFNEMKFKVFRSFNFFTCFYKKDVASVDDVTLNLQYKLFSMFREDFSFKNQYESFTKGDAEEIIEKHSKWLGNISHGLITTPLKSSLLLNNDRSYSSFIFYNNIWAEKFNRNASYEDNFQLSNGKTCVRKFMRIVNPFKYVHICKDNLEYHIVVIPYEKRWCHCTCYMFYLIPTTHDTDLSKLWDNFYTFCNGKISDSMMRWDLKNIYLHIPTLERLQSSFNLVDLLYDVFKYSKTYNLNASMTTYLNVDENDNQKDKNENFSHEIRCVTANRPHISFVLEYTSGRILLLTKDEGIISSE
ncbi:hypothetical protein NBO_42g0004 [Nosema bombycis CQ1]|uniref:Serpin domain-containing protein n=1 Tax=Nosema bombycis (strain CQ1 / CVCC 102059) TaxID=578461 RepID=R0M7P8_NOSB1|nr:hypothetical protein NBO_42g0004 [Nosema bombycis CQ1]|eukprot:EOB14014.1 hypothetical protein NBO_42g0004 [Nosema bombycis CQ1]